MKPWVETYRLLRDAGLCTKCKAPRVAGRVLCEGCRSRKQNAYRRECGKAFRAPLEEVRLAAALAKYGRHLPGCGAPCSCGLDEQLRRNKEASL